MHPAYKDDSELCQWLRENSSGTYRLAGFAAERIETLNQYHDNIQRECAALEALMEQHNSYQLGEGFSVDRHKRSGKWGIYHNAIHIDAIADPSNLDNLQMFDGFAEAFMAAKRHPTLPPIKS